MSIPTSAALSPSLILSELEANPYVLLALLLPIDIASEAAIITMIGTAKASNTDGFASSSDRISDGLRVRSSLRFRQVHLTGR